MQDKQTIKKQLEKYYKITHLNFGQDSGVGKNTHNKAAILRVYMYSVYLKLPNQIPPKVLGYSVVPK